MLVSYDLDGPVATIGLDDGKVNVMSLAMQDALHAALDRAEADGAVVVITGRDGVFSAGFDLNVLRARGEDGAAMVRGGFELAYRVLSFPRPVVMACTGHAIAMGVFLLLSGDYRIGVTGSYKLTANEVAIGLTLPNAALEILRQRLTPACFQRAAALAEPFSADTAVAAGFLDRVVEPAQLAGTVQATATALAGLDASAHAASKARMRRPILDALRAAMEADGLAEPA